MTRTGLLVLVSSSLLAAAPASQELPQDQGAAGAWQKLLKLRTTASLMHTTAHPDDEHGGMLAAMSRGAGARVSLLTLTRGESGDNAIGPELFDALGLIRTEELLVANRYYGVDRQYFTTAIDYGFSKRLDEALDKWGREALLRDMVRVIRTDRPLVVVSRFQGNPRDGHGNHQAAGLITQEAWKAAGDPAAFPDQLAQGLRPWQPLKLYIGGVRENEDWTVAIDSGEYSAALGDSYQNVARLGLSFQRSQNSGRFNPQPGPSLLYYKRVLSLAPAGSAATDGSAKERGFFDGIDTKIGAIFGLFGRPAPPGVQAYLETIDREVEAAVKAFTLEDPSASVPALARGLRAARDAIDRAKEEPDALFTLRVKEQQFEDAITAALGLDFSAIAQPPGTEEPSGPLAAFAPAPIMGPVVPGQWFDVRLAITNRSRVPIVVSDLTVTPKAANREPGPGKPHSLSYNERAIRRLRAALPPDTPVSRPYFRRDGLRQNRYDVTDEKQRHTAAGTPALVAVATYTVENVPVTVRRVVLTRESQAPFGYAMRELKVVPVLAVNVRPRQAIVPLAAGPRPLGIDVELLNNKDGPVDGTLALRLPEGWNGNPPDARFAFARAGEKRQFPFTISVPALENRDYRIEAVASAAGQEYREGYDVLEKRDLETRFLFRAATVGVRGVDVKIAPGLTVGYVMGIGDDVPSGIAQLGATVQLLGEEDLASSDLGRFDAIVTGTRAYAVRDDLRTYNQRLLEYVKAGGNLIVLYNTQELDPKAFAPYPGELTQRAEEVSEEDSPVDLLAPTHPVLREPNAITKADFDGWVEQRGSKFWSSWDKAYTPLIATWDKDQPPQQGGWLHARYGKGHYTYFAYAFHRQLPYGVPGAYRLLANLLSMGKGRS